MAGARINVVISSIVCRQLQRHEKTPVNTVHRCHSRHLCRVMIANLGPLTTAVYQRLCILLTRSIQNQDFPHTQRALLILPQGNPREAMLSVVPKVVEVSEQVLTRKHKGRQSSRARRTASPKASSTDGNNKEQDGQTISSRAANLPEGQPMLVGFLREAQFLVKSDSSGNMKRDMKALRALLSPP